MFDVDDYKDIARMGRVSKEILDLSLKNPIVHNGVCVYRSGVVSYQAMLELVIARLVEQNDEMAKVILDHSKYQTGPILVIEQQTKEAT